MTRAFTAIRFTPDETFKQAFQQLKNQLKDEKINWVTPDNLHLTLQFLGEINRNEINTLKRVFKLINFVTPFTMQMAGIHLFGNLKNPRLLYTEIQAGPELFDLVRVTDGKLNEINLYSRDKKFKPHITLGRIKFIKDSERFEEILSYSQKNFFQQTVCSEFILYESILKPSGPDYIPLEKFRLE